MKNRIQLIFFLLGSILVGCVSEEKVSQPNILFCIADDWGWPHAGVYGDEVVKTPTFDQLAREGILFDHAFVSSPSCTPSRGALLTGQHFWRLGEGANLWSTLSDTLPVYPLRLEKAGYFIGSWRKTWGPGDLAAGGYDQVRPAGPKYTEGFKSFLAQKPEDSPFCFWLGASDPHRGYEKGSGAQAGIDPEVLKVPKFYPDVDVIRNDIADYYFEVQRFDADVAAAIHLLDSLGELDNTIIVVTGDHGMPFPRCKGNIYDMGVRVPLVIRWGNQTDPGTRVADFVSLTDLAPTFLDLAGLTIPPQMTGYSLAPYLQANHKSAGSSQRKYAVFGRERHTPAQEAPSLDGYPSRGIRTDDFLYIKNFFPERWPAGAPEGATHPIGFFADCDDGPTKAFITQYAEHPDYSSYYDLCFGKRPAEELYDIRQDPYQLNNLAGNHNYISIQDSLSNQLITVLHATGDPRVKINTIDFDTLPYRAPYNLNSEK